MAELFVVLKNIHNIFGERVLPLLIVVAAIYLAVTWKPGAQPGVVARVFPILIDIQVTLGLILFVLGIVALGTAGRYLSLPFVLHPILGIAAAVIAHRAVKPQGLFSNWGRWAPLASLALLLVIVISNILVASGVG
jgi:hypothetical protein